MQDEHYPWRVLVCCALLNRTGRAQVRPMFEQLFAKCSTPIDMMAVDGEWLTGLLRPLGFQNRRADLLRRLSSDYVEGVPADQCFGAGQYARDALAIFVEGREDFVPGDHFLKPYLAWRKRHKGAKLFRLE